MLRKKSYKLSYEYDGRKKPDIQRYTTYENGQQKQKVVIQHESDKPGQITQEPVKENNVNGLLGWIIILIIIYLIFCGGSGEEREPSFDTSQWDTQADIPTAREIGEDMLSDVDEYFVRLSSVLAEKYQS